MDACIIINFGGGLTSQTKIMSRENSRRADFGVTGISTSDYRKLYRFKLNR